MASRIYLDLWDHVDIKYMCICIYKYIYIYKKPGFCMLRDLVKSLCTYYAGDPVSSSTVWTCGLRPCCLIALHLLSQGRNIILTRPGQILLARTLHSGHLATLTSRVLHRFFLRHRFPKYRACCCGLTLTSRINANPGQRITNTAEPD
jgi:hypothetical protein